MATKHASTTCDDDSVKIGFVKQDPGHTTNNSWGVCPGQNAWTLSGSKHWNKNANMNNSEAYHWIQCCWTLRMLISTLIVWCTKYATY